MRVQPGKREQNGWKHFAQILSGVAGGGVAMSTLSFFDGDLDGVQLPVTCRVKFSEPQADAQCAPTRAS